MVERHALTRREVSHGLGCFAIMLLLLAYIAGLRRAQAGLGQPIVRVLSGGVIPMARLPVRLRPILTTPMMDGGLRLPFEPVTDDRVTWHNSNPLVWRP